MKKEHEDQPWGYHLIVDAAECSDNINKIESVAAFLKEMVIELDMVALGAPILYYVDTPEGRGVTGVQIITTSTITFHGDADGNCIYVDIFSCKEYEPKTALDLINVYFSPKSVKKHWIVRNAPFNSV